MNWELLFGELGNDKEFVEKCDTLKENLMEVQQVLDYCLKLKEHYDKLPIRAQIELDLFLAFTLNSLQWIHLRVQGIDPSKHPINNEIERIKKAMLRWEEIKNRDKRPKVDKDAAKRFVRSGLYDPTTIGQPANKKKRFSED